MTEEDDSPRREQIALASWAVTENERLLSDWTTFAFDEQVSNTRRKAGREAASRCLARRSVLCGLWRKAHGLQPRSDKTGDLHAVSRAREYVLTNYDYVRQLVDNR